MPGARGTKVSITASLLPELISPGGKQTQTPIYSVGGVRLAGILEGKNTRILFLRALSASRAEEEERLIKTTRNRLTFCCFSVTFLGEGY